MKEKLVSGLFKTARSTALTMAMFPSPVASQEPAPEPSLIASPAPFVGVDSIYNPNDYDYRAVVNSPAAFVVCYSDVEPFPVEDPESDPQSLVIVDFADCVITYPDGSFDQVEDVYGEIERIGHAEITDLKDAREKGDGVPLIFETIYEQDRTVFYDVGPSPSPTS